MLINQSGIILKDVLFILQKLRYWLLQNTITLGGRLVGCIRIELDRVYSNVGISLYPLFGLVYSMTVLSLTMYYNPDIANTMGCYYSYTPPYNY